MPDHQLIGKIVTVTGRVAPGTVGEVLVPIRGGREAYYAFPAEAETLAVGEQALIIEQQGPREVLVSRYSDPAGL